MKKPVAPAAKPAEMVPAKAEPETPMQVMADIAGPYVRLDFSYGFTNDPDGSQGIGNLSAESIDDNWFGGGGIGYRHNENFRGDVTATYRPDADISATTSAGNSLSSEVNALSVMVNGYWDIAAIEGFVPYLGAGIGYSRLSTSDQTTTGGVANEQGRSSDNFAWALMAGAAVQVAPRTSIDVGYRFINLGEFGQESGTNHDDLMAHEVRAGLRYSF